MLENAGATACPACPACPGLTILFDFRRGGALCCRMFLDPEALERTTDGHRDAKKGTVHKRPATTQQVVSKAKASSKAKAKAGAKASNKAKAGAKAGSKAKAGAKAGSKAKAGAKSGLKPVVDRVKHKGGWTVEVRQRPTGQRDKSYIGPNGQVYRMQHEAESAGFVAK